MTGRNRPVVGASASQRCLCFPQTHCTMSYCVSSETVEHFAEASPRSGRAELSVVTDRDTHGPMSCRGSRAGPSSRTGGPTGCQNPANHIEAISNAVVIGVHRGIGSDGHAVDEYRSEPGSQIPSACRLCPAASGLSSLCPAVPPRPPSAPREIRSIPFAPAHADSSERTDQSSAVESDAVGDSMRVSVLAPFLLCTTFSYSRKNDFPRVARTT